MALIPGLSPGLRARPFLFLKVNPTAEHLSVCPFGQKVSQFESEFDESEPFFSAFTKAGANQTKKARLLCA
jgi:hypothetical protein